MKINTEVLKAMNPCKDRLANWELRYSDFKGDIFDFLALDAITPSDKIWVSLRLLPRIAVEIFAIDCAVSAEQYATTRPAAYADDAAACAAANVAANYADYADYAADYAADAADYADYAANYAGHAADYTAYNIGDAAYATIDASYAKCYGASARAAERNSQINVLIYLFECVEDGEFK